jgi:prepilin-type N-terminal cleavage/methylation domain-containing protein
MHFDLPLQSWHADCPLESLESTSASAAPADAATRLKSTARTRNSGFTLIEIALAMAIFSFALVSMLGLLSVGLKNSRKASIQIAAANILSAIAADIQSADISNLRNGTYDAATRKLKIRVSVSVKDQQTQVTLNSPQSLILDEACTPVSASGNTGLLKTFQVILGPTASNSGLAAIKVQIRWPANIPDTKQPEGSLDSLVALPTP